MQCNSSEQKHSDAVCHTEKVSGNDKTPSHHIDEVSGPSESSEFPKPRFDVTIAGPGYVSLSEGTYTLRSTLRYLCSQERSDELPVTISLMYPGCLWRCEDAYLFFPIDESSGAQERACQHDYPDFNIDDDPQPVSAGEGFVTLRPGEAITRDVPIWMKWWQDGLKAGEVYRLLMPHGFISWWEYGEMKVSPLRGTK